jgi:hypothetical protein
MSSAGIAAANCMLAAINAAKRREEAETDKKKPPKDSSGNWYTFYNDEIAQARSMISDIDKDIEKETDPYRLEFLNHRKDYWVRQAESAKRQQDQMARWQYERWERERKEMERFHRIQAIVNPIMKAVWGIVGAGSLFGIGVFIYYMLRPLWMK